MEARFGRERILKDVDNIPVGANFGQYIKSILPRCRVALLLIDLARLLEWRGSAKSGRMAVANAKVRMALACGRRQRADDASSPVC